VGGLRLTRSAARWTLPQHDRICRRGACGNFGRHAGIEALAARSRGMQRKVVKVTDSPLSPSGTTRSNFSTGWELPCVIGSVSSGFHGDRARVALGVRAAALSRPSPGNNTE
jgi:hypothetical protein